MKKVFSSDYQGNSLSFSLPLGAVITVALFVALPLTQIFSSLDDLNRDEEDNNRIVEPPPPPPPEPPPEEEEDDKEEDIELQKQDQQLTLDQINMALDYGDGGMSSSGVSVQVFDIADNFDDMIFEIADLDKPPIPLVKISPQYPPELKRNRVQGEVHLIFIVDQFGNVKRPRVSKSTNREFNENAIKAVRQWKFEPGEKDGRQVMTRVRLPLAFSLRR